jgi:uncharacterized protein YjbJ (UPF0337 family)
MKMSQSTKDQLEGTLHKVSGSIKESAGKVIDSPKLKAEGQNEHLKGKVQKKVGDLEAVLEK